MRPGMKMLMAANRARETGNAEHDVRRAQPRSGGAYGGMEYETTRNEYNGSGMNYGGVEGRNNAEMPRADGYETDDRYETAARRYRRDERGRFMPNSEYMGGGDEMNYRYPAIPPVYNNERRGDERRFMNRIGFDIGEEITYPQMAEMENRASPTAMGHAKSRGGMVLTREMADEWMEDLENEDGTKGPHWTFDQAKQVMAQKGVKTDPLSFWVILNSMYADYCKVFKKYGVGDKLDLYIDMTKAFIEDKDAVEGKVAAYYENIAKH